MKGGQTREIVLSMGFYPKLSMSFLYFLQPICVVFYCTTSWVFITFLGSFYFIIGFNYCSKLYISKWMMICIIKYPFFSNILTSINTSLDFLLNVFAEVHGRDKCLIQMRE
ncbi:hypothetical protein BDA99DRAFT_502787 [Phascolomyces articulosus]|uniref:Uncharacterized protein n=1 Tax=Phascolomyces articulosus TaxID=60185 RepID=A0AAD5KEG3_9FUNG|nr:hypothetical protein BDA99DRAFT_502787 [Phascolomyces articulosus]